MKRRGTDTARQRDRATRPAPIKPRRWEPLIHEEALTAAANRAYRQAKRAGA